MSLLNWMVKFHFYNLKDMKNIGLFGGNAEAQPKEKEKQWREVSEDKNSRIEAKRPQHVKTMKNESSHLKRWRECKIIGKNISIRSYSAACAFQNKLYVYGGYQILKGMMNDFYWIDLDDHVEKYTWVPIEAGGQLPGPRSKHALVGGRKKIYLLCGLSSDLHSSSQIFEFDPEKKSWSLIKTEGDKLPELDSFGCIYMANGDQQRIVIICGYDGKNAEYLNSVYEYNITKNKIITLHPGSKSKDGSVPIPRSGCAAATDGKNIYIFGGKDQEKRMNDLWEFNMTQFKYRRMEDLGDVPASRNGHTMQFFQGKLYVFGGIHDITWELDDLHIYTIAKKKWTTLEQDSPRKVDRKKLGGDSINKDRQVDKKSPKKKNWYQTANTLFNKTSNEVNSPPQQRAYQTSYKQQETTSPGKMIDEQRKKIFLQKKAEMLKTFDVDKEQQYIIFQTSSQAMKNTLDVIGNPDPKQKIQQGKLTDFGKQTASKFLQPLQNNSNLIYGKKPCARDGHSAVMLNNELIIFGGDRHQMSFNDIFKLNFFQARAYDYD